MKAPRWRISLAVRLTAAVGILLTLVVASIFGLDRAFPDHHVAIAAGVLVVALLLLFVIVRTTLRPLLSMFHALSGTVLSYKDGDYAFGLHWGRNDEVGDLVDAHNALGQVLRDQRLELIRRELLLDTMVQNTPVAMLLVAEHGAIVFANIAARQLLNGGRRLEGHHVGDLVHDAP